MHECFNFAIKISYLDPCVRNRYKYFLKYIKLLLFIIAVIFSFIYIAVYYTSDCKRESNTCGLLYAVVCIEIFIFNVSNKFFQFLPRNIIDKYRVAIPKQETPRLDEGAKPGPVLGNLASAYLYWPMCGSGYLT